MTASATHENPVAEIGCNHLQMVLSAAGHLAGRLSVEEGLQLLALACAAETTQERATMHYVIWCRVYGRRDLLEFLAVDPLCAVRDIVRLCRSSDLSRFESVMFGQAVDAGWPGQTHKLEDMPDPGEGSRFDALAARFEAGLGKVMLSSYSEKRYKPLSWEKAVQACLDASVAPASLLLYMEQSFGGTPWPDSFGRLARQFADGALGEYSQRSCALIRLSDSRLMLQHLIDADLMPWQLAASVLNAARLERLKLEYVPLWYWEELVWQLMDRRLLTPEMEQDLAVLF
jgi:hypothetical protein